MMPAGVSHVERFIIDGWVHDQSVLFNTRLFNRSSEDDEDADEDAMSVGIAMLEIVRVASQRLMCCAHPNDWWLIVLALVSAHSEHSTQSGLRKDWDLLLQLLISDTDWVSLAVEKVHATRLATKRQSVVGAATGRATGLGELTEMDEEDESDSESASTRSSESQDDQSSVASTDTEVEIARDQELVDRTVERELEAEIAPRCEAAPWVPRGVWFKLKFLELSAPDELGGLCDHITRHAAQWLIWVRILSKVHSETPEDRLCHMFRDFPLSRTKVLLVCTCLCRDALPPVVMRLLGDSIPDFESSCRLESLLDVGALYQYSSPQLVISLFTPVDIMTGPPPTTLLPHNKKQPAAEEKRKRRKAGEDDVSSSSSSSSEEEEPDAPQVATTDPRKAGSMRTPPHSLARSLAKTVTESAAPLPYQRGLKVSPLNPLREVLMCAAHLGIDTVVLTAEPGLKREAVRSRFMEHLKKAIANGQWLIIEVVPAFHCS